ncbi:hypothetical protein R5Q78_004387 [Escherichia coli]|nr:hypothetical protein [Escherichia coli]
MTETESAILAHARRCAPAESCGFVVRAPEGERYFPCVNISGEPRITCNAYLTTQRKAWDVLSDFCSAMRCMPVWNGQTLTFVQDRPSDMRGWTIKGKPASGRAVLSQEQDGIKSHTHSASASSTDLGTKTTSSFDYGTKSTNNTGAHTHSLSGSTSSAGAHSHVDGRRFNTSTFKDTYQYGSTAVGSNSYQVQGAVGLGIGTMANTNSAGAHRVPSSVKACAALRITQLFVDIFPGRQ